MGGVKGETRSGAKGESVLYHSIKNALKEKFHVNKLVNLIKSKDNGNEQAHLFVQICAQMYFKDNIQA